MHTRTVAAACAAVLTVGGAAWGSAAAAPHAAKGDPTVTTIAKKLTMPLSVAQAPDGTRYWTDQDGLWRLPAAGGTAALLLASTRKAPVEGVSADGGVLRFATGSKGDNQSGNIWTYTSTGALVKVADTFAYEKSVNPDRHNRYGFLKTPKSCLAKLPKQVPGSYKGTVETHPYSTAYANGTTYIGDAAGNAVLAVSAAGTVSTVAVLKPVKLKITAAAAKANGLPSCTIGKKYAVEAVPTDVELGPDGWLYVTSLPGGPEDDSLGANGRVLKINPATGQTTTLADGLLSPTGVAVAANGDVYVAELFPGIIAKIRAGGSKVRTYTKAPFPAALEATPTGLLGTINALPMTKKPKGAVVTMTP